MDNLKCKKCKASVDDIGLRWSNNEKAWYCRICIETIKTTK